MADWNWFFSSLAQSAAAIVGLFGAFLVARVLSNEAAYTQKKTRLTELLARSERLVDDADSRYFEWYNDRMSDEAVDSIRWMWRQHDRLDKTPQQIYDVLSFSEFLPEAEALALIQSTLDTLLAEREAREAKKRAQMGISFGDLDYESLVPGDNGVLQNRLHTERTAISELERNVRQNQREIRELIEAVEAGPKPSRHINAALVATGLLFYVGVIYPLSFLPSASAPALSVSAFLPLLFSLKGALLAATSLIFTVLLLLFVWVNSRMKFGKSDVAALEPYLDVATYSPYLFIKADNEARARAREEGNAA